MGNQKLPFFLKTVFVAGMLLVSLGRIAMANDSYRLDHTQSVLIDKFSNCRIVTNNSGSDLFIPTKTSAEWTAFRNNLPSGTTADPCQPWTKIIAGANFTCGLKNGGYYCWGLGTSGQLGDGTWTTKNKPTNTIDFGGSTPGRVAAGSGHACGHFGTNVIRCWGLNGSGQLGDGTQTNRNTPVQLTMPGSSYYGDFSMGHAHSCVNRSGSMNYFDCWGSNSGGQIGALANPQLTPAQLSNTKFYSWAASGFGETHTCAEEDNARIFCWGGNQYGQAGKGDATNPSPIGVVLNVGSNPRNFTNGYHHSCAIKSDYTVMCWGRNNAGQLGLGDYDDRSSPTAVPGLTGVQEIRAGYYHTCARINDGTVKCWGQGTDGQLGNGGNSNQPSPVTVTGLTGATELAAGAYHSCAALGNGGVMACWGLNTSGELGRGNYTSTNTPVDVVNP